MTTPRLCAAPDCGKPSRGTYCEMHRARLKRGGSFERRVPRQTLDELLGGRRFTMWTVLHEGDPYERPLINGKRNPDGRQRTARCQCDCGAERDIPINTLKRGQSTHCGCLMSQITTAAKTTHGMSYTAEHRAWAKMKARCSDQNSKDWPLYGGRGILVCAEWRDSFEAFFAYLGAKPTASHSIDRIDVNGNYEPGNVRWATPSEQMQNVRHNVMVNLDGENVALREACRRLGVIDKYKGVHARMRKGMGFEHAVAIYLPPLDGGNDP